MTDVSNSNEDDNEQQQLDQIKTFINSFNSIENYVAKYIYKKYIESSNEEEVESSDEENIESSNEEEVESSDEENIESINEEEEDEETPKTDTCPIYSKKPIDSTKYNQYLAKIFAKQRVSRITQEQLLTNEINCILKADEKLDEMCVELREKKKKCEITANTKFSRTDIGSFPDILRCNYIIKHKNKLHRCGLKILSDECELCYKHARLPNIYWDRYCELLEKMENAN
jgi:hypothetical protein